MPIFSMLSVWILTISAPISLLASEPNSTWMNFSDRSHSFLISAGGSRPSAPPEVFHAAHCAPVPGLK